MKNSEIKITALASNEGLYLPQWIYHHDYFGFNAFEIIINRTTDCSLEVIERLKTKFPNISTINFDWIDYQSQAVGDSKILQNGAYLFTYLNTSSHFDYVFYIDIDEFWMPKNCSDKIQDCIAKLNFPDAIGFQYLWVGGQKDYGMPVLSARKIYGDLHPTIKSMIRTGLRPTEIGAHRTLFKSVDRYMLPDGERLETLPDTYFYRVYGKQSTVFRDYFLYHDYYRSVSFFLAGMVRGCPFMSNARFANRIYLRADTWKLLNNPPGKQLFDNHLPSEYFKNFSNLINELDLQPLFRQCLIKEYLYALEALRRLALEPESKAAICSRNMFGDLKALKRRIMKSLICLDSAYADLQDFRPIKPEDIPLHDINLAMEQFRKAIRLYPLAKNVTGEPAFLKAFLTLLLENNFITEAIGIMNDKNLLVNQISGTDWGLYLLAEAFEKSGCLDKALDIYHKLSYAERKDILQKRDAIIHKMQSR